MAQFTCDPTLKPGETVLAAYRTTAGPAYAWEPGGDADAYVKFVGPEHLAVVDGQVYARLMDGSLHPHLHIKDAHVVVRPVAGQPIYLTFHEFTTQWAVLDTAALIAAADAKLADAIERAERFQQELIDAQLEHADQLAAAYQIDNGVVIAVENVGPVVPPPADASEAGAEGSSSTPAPAEPKRGPGRPAGSKNKPKDA